VREGDNMLDFADPRTVADFKGNVGRAMGGEKVLVSRQLTLGKGVTLWAEVQYLPAYDATGQVFAVAFVALDITDRKRAEAAILELNAGLERRVAERTAQLQAINKELEAFSYSVSHDLRAPLRSIDGFSKAVLEDYAHLLDAEGQDYLQSIRTASQRMGQLIDDLLKLSRVTRGEMQHEPVNLAELVRDIEEELRRAEIVAILGRTVARTLFGEADPIDRTVRVRNVPVRVIGVMAPKGQSAFGQDQDDVIFVPLDAGRRRVIGRNYAKDRSVGSIFIKFDREEDIAPGIEQVTALLRQRHRVGGEQEDDFAIRNLTEIAQTASASANTLSMLLAAVAAVSLLVGGIGIMNIMLVSVTERTREIGLRLAVGARPRDILGQFLIEATTLATIGGAIGVALGVGTAQAIASAAGWPALVSPNAILIAVVFSALVGIFFGFYPAQRAAQLDPIEALRRE